MIDADITYINPIFFIFSSAELDSPVPLLEDS